MTNRYAIFANGTYQGTFPGADEIEALRSLDEDVGINPNDADWDDLAEEFEFHKVTPEEEADVDAWWQDGAKADEFPLQD